jgi:hypothetical protein
MAQFVDDTDRGLYRKFNVERTDGRSAPGEKHHGCRYFVLDLDHDPHAIWALRAYINACRESNPSLAADLDPLAYPAAPPRFEASTNREET